MTKQCEGITKYGSNITKYGPNVTRFRQSSTKYGTGTYIIKFITTYGQNITNYHPLSIIDKSRCPPLEESLQLEIQFGVKVSPHIYPWGSYYILETHSDTVSNENLFEFGSPFFGRG